MTLLYFDTSALLKGYLREAGTGQVCELLERARLGEPTAQVFVSVLAYPEAVSAVSRREAAGELTGFEARRLVQRLEQDFADVPLAYNVLGATHPVAVLAAAVARQHRLRGFDAVHLATALVLRAATSGLAMHFVVSDKRLAAAAQAEGFAVFNPEAT